MTPRDPSASASAPAPAARPLGFSIVIPARDEERHIGACLDSIARAAARHPCEKEVIVVLNRCTDGTEAIARRAGAGIVREDGRNLSRIRNAGARAASGDVLVTIDADSRMSANMLGEIARALGSGKYIGGGVPIVPERRSAGILLTGIALAVLLMPSGLSAGLFWCRRADFEAIGGFDESKTVAEDVDFARRLKARGRQKGLRFGTLWRTSITTSCRKFDRFGDWFFLRLLVTQPRAVRDALRGKDPGLADRMFYDFER